MKSFVLTLFTLLIVACQQAPDAAPEAVVEAAEPETRLENSLANVLAAQPVEMQARYQYRHPQETIEFFGIEPGMTVLEGLPGGGWYTKVLLPYLGAEGRVIGANYSMEMYPLFSFATEEFLQRQRTWQTDWVAEAEGWGGDEGALLDAFYFGSMPAACVETADVVFFARVLHNLARFESEGNYLTTALADSYAALKPGGTFGVVQHHARDNMSDAFADGSHGYLKKSFVIAAAEQAGFEFVAEMDINANPADQPSEEDIVWRLPPRFATSADNPELKAELQGIGESNRMTLKFRKPR